MRITDHLIIYFRSNSKCKALRTAPYLDDVESFIIVVFDILSVSSLCTNVTCSRVSKGKPVLFYFIHTIHHVKPALFID